MEKTVRIGAGSAFFSDSRTGLPQLLRSGGRLDYIVFDHLSEGTMPLLARAQPDGPGYAADFVDQLTPHLAELLERGVRVIGNAGGFDPAGCAAALKARASALGLSPRIGVVEGDDLRTRVAEFVTPDTRDMFDASPVAQRLEHAGAPVSLVAYTGAFPIAAALSAGADIVITGRAVDSAATLGALIHEFGWREDDFDRLASGTLAGHLIECSTQVSGGTFTDWRDVPDWAGIGFPIAECSADGAVVITKPKGTGGLVSIGTVSEQLFYEVSDPQRYIVPDVVCDFTEVRIEQAGADRVRVTGARGLGRTSTAKLSLTYEDGWRATVLIPVIGRDARERAERIGTELFARTRAMLRSAQLADWTDTRCDVIGGEAGGSGPVICRLVADHPQVAGAGILAREQVSFISVAVGVLVAMGVTVKPVYRIAGFLHPKSDIALKLSLDGAPLAYTPHDDGDDRHRPAPSPLPPAPPSDADPAHTVPLVRLAWARSGDKGDLFNVAVIAREPPYLPYIAAALTPQVVGAFYGEAVGEGAPFPVDRFFAPGPGALNFVVASSLQGGISSSPRIDPAAKGMAQLLLDHPIPVSPALFTRFDSLGRDR